MSKGMALSGRSRRTWQDRGVIDSTAESAERAAPGSRSDVRPRPGDLLDLRVEGLAYGGAGIARRNGYVVFVEDAFPGDRVRAEVLKSKRDFAKARAVELLEPSADRVPERCDHDGRSCPGSPW